MGDEDPKERARKLREEMDKVAGKVPRTPEELAKRSLHEKVQDRMRELEREKREADKPDGQDE